jgi:hypothetical protein
VIPSSVLKDVIVQVKRRALEVVKQIRSGRFPLAELSESEAGCRNCDFGFICRAADRSEDEGNDATH